MMEVAGFQPALAKALFMEAFRYRLVLLCGLLIAATAPAQSPLEKRIVLTAESPQAANRLHALDRQLEPLSSATEAAKFVGSSAPASVLRPFAALLLDDCAQEKWEQALEDYQKLSEEAGDTLVPLRMLSAAGLTRLDGDPLPSVQLRRLIQSRIAALPPSMAQRHRQNVDTRAQKLLQEGKQERAAAPLCRLVDEFFGSSFTAEALELLGDLAFEEGEFEDALGWWRRLAVPSTEYRVQTNKQSGPNDSNGPNSLIGRKGAVSTKYSVLGTHSSALARVRAKQVLAYAFLGQLERAKSELAAYAKLHPDAKGTLAGADGPYRDILAQWLERLATRAADSNHDAWTTFAGNPARNRSLNVCPNSRLWIDGPTWRVPLPTATKVKEGKGAEVADKPLRASPADRLAYYPLVVGSQVLIANADSVMAYELFTGKQLFRFVLKEGGPRGQATGTGRYTLTAWNRRVFARLGGQSLGPKGPAEKADPPSVLVCLDLSGAQPGALLWRIVAIRPEKAPAFFEGAPLAAEGRVFCAVSWVVGQRTHTAVACYDAYTGRRRWWQEVCAAPEFEDQAESRRRQHLLTMGGGRLYYCSHTGAVLALDPWSGQCLWGTRYGGRAVKADDDALAARTGQTSARDLAPGVYADNRLYLAPLDAKSLLCLDAGSGRLLWQRDAPDIVHLLGVTRGKVYFATKRGLQCLAADDGSARAGWMQPAEGRLPSMGRGLLAGSWLLWPTQDPKLPLRGVTLADGNQERFDANSGAPAEPEYLEPTMLRAILPGNMAFGEDCLVVAGLEELAAFVPPRYFLQERREKLKDAKATPLALYQFAMAQADAGLAAAAEQSLYELRGLAEPLDTAKDWIGLSYVRSSEMRGLHTKAWKLKFAAPESFEAIGRPEVDQRGTLDLPLQKSLEMPARHVQNLAQPASKLTGVVLGQGKEELFGLDALAGKIRWHKPVTAYPFFNAHALWLGTFGDFALRIDTERVVGLDLQQGGGQRFWINLIPLQPMKGFCLQDNAPRRVGNPFPPGHFQCNNRLLFFMVDERLLVALDPLSGKFAWVFWAPGGEIRPLDGGGKFNPRYYAGDRFVVLQTSSGKRLTLDSQTGKLLHQGPAAEPWPQPPLALDQSHTVLGDSAGQVLLLDAATGQVAWTYRPAGPTSLTGAPSQAFGDKGKLLALVPRNIGPELVRLDPNNGTRLWSVPFLPADCGIQNVSVDDAAVYCVCQGRLQARSLRDGKLLWQKRLPGGFPSWQIARARDVLLVYPLANVEAPELSPLVWPSLPFAPITFRPLSKHQQDRAILVLDARDGQWLQRLPLANEPGPVSVQVGNNVLVVAAGGQLCVYQSTKR
jgi:outer membrane protein assembly factor BamB